MREPTQEYLRECFNYVDGKLFWKERPRHHFNTDRGWKFFNNNYVSKEAGWDDYNKQMSTFYRKIDISCKGRGFRRSRLVWIMFNGYLESDSFIDHRNGITLDDSVVNIRKVTPKLNSRNKRKYSNNTTGHTGITVDRDGRKKPYRSAVYDDKTGKRRTKSFETIEEAIKHREIELSKRQGYTKRHGK